MHTIKGYMVDPLAKTVSEVTFASDMAQGTDGLRRLIGCDYIEYVYADAYKGGMPKVAVVIDEEGLLHGGPKQFFTFSVNGYTSNPLCGKAMVIGLTEQRWDAQAQTEVGGDFMDCPLTLDEVRQRVGFIPLEQMRRFSAAGGFDGSFTTQDKDGRITVTPMPLRPELPDEQDNTDTTGDKS